MFHPASKFLVADDYDLVRFMIKEILLSLGAGEVCEASNGEEAWTLISRSLTEGKPFDIVFIDWNMPVIDGIALLDLCKSEPKLENMLKIMITAESEKAFIIKALTSGADEYIIKPVSSKNLKEKISSIISKKRQIKDHGR